MLKKTLNLFYVALWILAVLPIGLSAQNLKKGYKLLEKADYEKAYEVFGDALSGTDQNPAALFGMALVFADEKSPRYDVIGAWDYARKLQQNIDKLSTEESEFIGEYFYNTEVRHISRPVRKKMDYAIETMEAKLIKYVREENNLEVVYRVLDKFPDFRHHDNILHIRNQLEFRKYEKQNTLEGYLEFIQKFPDAAQIDKAIKYRNKLSFEKVCEVNTVEAYKDFMKQYPQAAEINLAVKRLHAVAFDRAKQLNTIAAFDEFIAHYPDALEISEARTIQKQLLYDYAKKIHTLEAYNEFIRKYPEGQQYIDIFNLKALDNGMQFLNQHPFPSSNMLWARSFDEEGNYELSASITADTMNNYVIGGTVFKSDTRSTEAWIIKLAQDGKMTWNKYISEGYNDEVNLISVNPKNEILGAGYTWIGTDSASRESWLFKLGPEGQKLWSRKLGRMNIRTMKVTADGTIFLGGYLINDSLQKKYSVIVLNENGKRLWSRTYTGNGEIFYMGQCPDERMLIVGNHWHAKTDPKGYLIWESPFSASDSIIAAQIMPKGEICYLGFRNREKMMFIKTGPDNKPITEKEIKLPELPKGSTEMIPGPQNQLVVVFTMEQHQTINWISASGGEIIHSARIPDGMKIDQIKTDRKNNLLLVGCMGEILVFRNNGTTF
jgi:thioredoxin-like negative regulator of GroEL